MITMFCKRAPTIPNVGPFFKSISAGPAQTTSIIVHINMHSRNSIWIGSRKYKIVQESGVKVETTVTNQVSKYSRNFRGCFVSNGIRASNRQWATMPQWTQKKNIESVGPPQFCIQRDEAMYKLRVCHYGRYIHITKSIFSVFTRIFLHRKTNLPCIGRIVSWVHMRWM